MEMTAKGLEQIAQQIHKNFASIPLLLLLLFLLFLLLPLLLLHFLLLPLLLHFLLLLVSDICLL